MRVRFYGTRGSIAVSDREYLEFGGDTSCVLVMLSNGRVGILDAGTGIRKLGNDLIAADHEQFDNIFIGFSHTHWDHIQGFPFFKLAYDSRREFTLAIPGRNRSAKSLKDIFATQMQDEYFPTPLNSMGAAINFWEPEDSGFTSDFGIDVATSKHNHPGGAYGYRIHEEEKVLVYCTDVEHGEVIDPGVVAFARGADLLIHDAQYTPDELKEKKGWGHSSWVQAVEVAERAGVKKLALFHHDPEHPDSFLLNIEKQCQERFPGCFVAREGMEIEL